jgi:hypothetical protein
MLRPQIKTAANLLLLVLMTNLAGAQESPGRERKDLAANSGLESTGLATSRLSQKDLDRWKAIEALVFSEYTNQQPMHPTLRNLWEWIETSGHLVFVEVVRTKRTSTCTAGSFSIERIDPRGERHVAVIRLNLSNIDQAYVGPDAARVNGFIPFEGLGKVERYAEVLGHELAHAVHILTSLDRSRLVEDMVERTNEMLLSRQPKRKEIILSTELKRRLKRRDSLLLDLEKQAEAMEYIVWKEITSSKPLREKTQPAAYKR